MEFLIELVRQNKLLYDASDVNYSRTKYKDVIWKSIAKELNYTSIQSVKDAWRKLRDCHRDALRRQKRKKSGSGSTTSKQWAYQKQMEFLLPYMMNRTAGNTNDCQDENGEIFSYELSYHLDEKTNDDETDDPLASKDFDYNRMEEHSELQATQEQDLLQLKEEQDEQQQITQEQGDYQTSQNQDENEKNTTLPVQRSEPSIINKRRKIYKVLHKTSENYQIRNKQRDEERKRITFLQNQRNLQEESEMRNDSLYQFFLSMYNDVKRMNKASQLRIKKKLFDAVQLEEEASLSAE